jgi:hypothetical protein
MMLLVALASVGSAASAVANQPPGLSDVEATVDLRDKTVTVHYVVHDAESDDLQIDLRVSADGGVTFLVDPDSISGDAGFPVEPGQRTLVWHYGGQPLDGGEYIAKIVADDGFEIDLGELVAAVDTMRLRADITFMEGPRHYGAGPDLIAATKDYIEDTFRDFGLQASRQSFAYNSVTAENIIGRLPGETREAEVFIIDGHFDTVNTTAGADDNASGVAGMLEAMRILSQVRFERTIKFLGFDLEEVGLIGSLRYVREGQAPFDVTLGVLNFEMIGYTCDTPGCDDFAELGNYIHNISDVQSNWLRAEFDLAASTLVPDLIVESTEAVPSNPNFRRSDHARFWDAGIPALFLTDGANFRNPHYHRMSDTVETLDFEFMANVVRVAVATVAKQAGPLHAGVGLSQPFLLEKNVATEGRSFGSFKQSFPQQQDP